MTIIALLKHLPGKHNQKLHAPKTVAPSGGYNSIKEQRKFWKDFDSADPATRQQLAEERIQFLYSDFIDYNEANNMDEEGRLLDRYWDLPEQLTGAEQWAISEYTGNGYIPINDKLRGTRTSLLEAGMYTAEAVAYREKAEKLIPDLDSAIKRAKPIPNDMVVYRTAPDIFLKQVSSLGPGTVLKDKGFVSTSLGNERADSAVGSSNQVGLSIALPAGSKGMYVQKLSEVYGEHEVLLPRNSKFRYLGRNRAPSGHEFGPHWLEYIG